MSYKRVFIMPMGNDSAAVSRFIGRKWGRITHAQMVVERKCPSSDCSCEAFVSLTHGVGCFAELPGGRHTGRVLVHCPCSGVSARFSGHWPTSGMRIAS